MNSIFSKELQLYAEERYKKVLPLLKNYGKTVAEYLESLEGDEKLLLQFLYGTMPISDAASYSPDLFHGYVKHGLFLYRQVPWTRELGEDIFLNYVLYYRVNNEDITDCRAWFHRMLWPLVEKLSLEEAIKEINYWCAGQASYAASDERTLSPVGVFNSGTGRCGEESTFLVTALRSVGIAARQVYTPRWSHCDDNHAWVEALIDGKWHFLGACEPEEVLDKGWFTNASSRAMLIHTRAFSDYWISGHKEDITEHSGAALLYNDTCNYAKVKKLTVEVCDLSGLPVPNARVEFQLLNAACYYSVSVLDSDELGCVSLMLGLGSIQIQAALGEQVSQSVIVDTKTTDRVKLTLSKAAWQDQIDREKKEWQFLDHIAPREYPMHPIKLTLEQKELGKARKKEAENQRQRKLEGYYDVRKAEKYPEAQDMLRLAYGNMGELYDFLEKYPVREAERLLRVLTAKDYRDITGKILSDHLEYALKIKEKSMETYLHGREDGENLFDRYVMNPRIEFEMITPYRAFLDACLSPEQKERFFEKPEEIKKWIEEICESESLKNYEQIVTSPEGLIRTGQGCDRSRKILFVAICRTLGIPARIDPITREAQYYHNGIFLPASGGDDQEKEVQKKVRLTLLSEESPAYYSRWTIGRLSTVDPVSGEKVYTGFQTLDCLDKSFTEGRLTLDLEEGIYRILTATRLPNGNQLEARRILDTRDFLPAADGVKEHTMELVLRRPELSQMLEELELEEFVLKDETGKEHSFSALAKEKDTLLAFLETGMEPTEHLLNELNERQLEVRESGLNICFVVQGKESLEHPTFANTLKWIPSGVYYDTFQELPEQLARRMYTDPEKLPLVILVSRGRKGRFACSGYNVGSVEMTLRIAKLLQAEDKKQ